MAASIIQCKMCKRAFNSYGTKLCRECEEKTEEGLAKIRDYLYDNPGNHSAEKLNEETGVTVEVIVHLIKENRLTANDSTISEGLCMYCKKPYSGGAICDDCRAKLSSQLAATLPQQAPAEKKQKAPKRLHDARSSKMHIDISKRKK